MMEICSNASRDSNGCHIFTLKRYQDIATVVDTVQNWSTSAQPSTQTDFIHLVTSARVASR